jgi:hypothetical protein
MARRKSGSKGFRFRRFCRIRIAGAGGKNRKNIQRRDRKSGAAGQRRKYRGKHADGITADSKKI